MKQGQAEPATPPTEVAGAPLAIEPRHLSYFVALADAGSFTRAAEQMFIAQPTLSQQIRRLEEIVGTQLLQRRREGLQLTTAGAVLLDAMSLGEFEPGAWIPAPHRSASRHDQPRRADPPIQSAIRS
jgi:hypothetical protein